MYEIWTFVGGFLCGCGAALALNGWFEKERLAEEEYERQLDDELYPRFDKRA